MWWNALYDTTKLVCRYHVLWRQHLFISISISILTFQKFLHISICETSISSSTPSTFLFISLPPPYLPSILFLCHAFVSLSLSLGGVKRMSNLIYEETRGVLMVFLEKVIQEAITYASHSKY